MEKIQQYQNIKRDKTIITQGVYIYLRMICQS